MKKRGETFLPAPFHLSQSTEEWLALNYPQVDRGKTLCKFCDEAAAKGWMYRDWQAAFRTVVRKGIDNGWRSIVTISGRREFDPKWQQPLHEGRKHGWREPNEHETPASYNTALQLWLTSPESRRSRVVDVSALVASKRIN